MELHRIHAVVHGRVQAVGFRFFVNQFAATLGLSGWVRNRVDGSVELVAEGDKASLERLLALVGQGPPSARVERVDAEWQAATGEHTGFSARPTA
ncbi:MAG: acylphosphatase [Chloroflexi bacterium]|nr:acylphosphatase [Chloroflexota bacterium]